MIPSLNVDFDIDFFLNEAKKTKGKVLELTSGTGRVSMPLLNAGIDLTCVDYSREMLAVLKKKIEKSGLNCQVHKMDITELSLDKKYDLILIPFNSLSEITEKRNHKKTIEGVYNHLTETGVFICTLHNPKIRLKTIDGTLRQMGKYQISNDRTLIMQYIFNYSDKSQIVSGLQFYEIYDDSNNLIGKRYLDVNFYLFQKKEFEELIESVGFRIIDLYGDYYYSRFDEETSPYMIWKMRK